VSKSPIRRLPSSAEPLAALAFKTVAGPAGDLVYVRVYSGTLRPKDEVLNVTAGKRERVSRIYRMMGDRREALDEAGPGDIVALMGVRSAATGHTLCALAAPIVLEAARFPEPVVAQALLPDRATDEAKLADALARLVRDDPTLKFKTDPQTKELVLSGMGELHLEVSVEKLHRNPGVRVSVGRPMVAYRQTISRPVEVETRYIKQSGGHGQYAVITCRFEPIEQETDGLEFVSAIVGGAVRREFVTSMEAGFRDACRRGAKFGFPCVGVRCTLLDGKEHEKDSSADSFRTAAIECTREAQGRAGVTLLEPIMTVVVVCPETHQGALIGDINRRRGQVQRFESGRGRAQIRATVPLAELFGYAGDLRNVTSGTASFSMEPSHYAPVRVELAALPPVRPRA
jgi:elongation factor G